MRAGNSKPAKHRNLFYDSGTLYSYGYHYPLAFIVNGIVFVNTTGYSTTTARHISLARPYADEEVELYSEPPNQQGVQDALLQSIRRCNIELDELKRTGTKREYRLLVKALRNLQAYDSISPKAFTSSIENYRNLLHNHPCHV